jgi:hypothetical protein
VRTGVHSKKGSTAVFLTMILASVLLTVGLFIHAASHSAGRSYADAVFDLAGRSVLSEYDLQLQKRYGLFAIHTDESQAEEKIKYYAGYSFHDNRFREIIRGKAYINVLKVDLDSVSVSLKGYSLTDVNLFEDQILAYMKTGIVKDNLLREKDFTPRKQNVILRNDQIISSLPSSGYGGSLFADIKKIAENGLPSIEEIEEEAKGTFLVNEYITGHFLDHIHGSEKRNTFFQNEIEYIIKGSFDDQRNYSAVRTDLFIIRNVLNLSHIYSDPTKQAKVKAIAAELSLGAAEPIAEPAVAEAWAAAETENDLRLLEDGKPVALIKSKENWAVPISNTLEYLYKDGYMKPKLMNGNNYEDYLRILLYLEEREKKLLRCMDLIQLNMKGSYNRGFDLKEYYGGFRFVAVANDRTYEYIQKY